MGPGPQGGLGVVAWVAVAGCRVVRLWWPSGLWLQCERKTVGIKQVCGPGWSHGMAGGSPAARVVMLCGPGGAPGRGLRGALAEGASAVPGEVSRAAMGDPLAEGRCASEG